MNRMTEKELAQKLIEWYEGDGSDVTDLAAELGIPLAPEKPAPGVYLDKGEIVHIDGAGHHEGSHYRIADYGSTWAVLDGVNLTPAVVVPRDEWEALRARPVPEYVELTDGEVATLTINVVTSFRDVREGHRAGWDAAVAAMKGDA